MNIAHYCARVINYVLLLISKTSQLAQLKEKGLGLARVEAAVNYCESRMESISREIRECAKVGCIA